MPRTRVASRCGWGRALDEPACRADHDRESGRPVHNDRRLFAFLILEGMQAVGLVNDHTRRCFRWRAVGAGKEGR